MNASYQPGTLAPLIPETPRSHKPKKGLWIGLAIGVILLCCIAGVAVVVIERDRIPVVAGLFTTHTQSPTPTHTPIPAKPTETSIPATPTPKTLTLTDKAFEADLKETCNTDVQITEVKGTSFSVKGNITMRNNQMYVWCYDARHTWIGTLVYAGYTFASDTSDPLQFVVDQNRGYLYIAGKGTVTLPDGKTVSLP